VMRSQSKSDEKSPTRRAPIAPTEAVHTHWRPCRSTRANNSDCSGVAVAKPRRRNPHSPSPTVFVLFYVAGQRKREGGLMPRSYGRPRTWVGSCPAISPGSTVGRSARTADSVDGVPTTSVERTPPGSEPCPMNESIATDKWAPGVGTTARGRGPGLRGMGGGPKLEIRPARGFSFLFYFLFLICFSFSF
jgi:hypothetical protein